MGFGAGVAASAAERPRSWPRRGEVRVRGRRLRSPEPRLERAGARLDGTPARAPRCAPGGRPGPPWGCQVGYSSGLAPRDQRVWGAGAAFGPHQLRESRLERGFIFKTTSRGAQAASNFPPVRAVDGAGLGRCTWAGAGDRGACVPGSEPPTPAPAPPRGGPEAPGGGWAEPSPLQGAWLVTGLRGEVVELEAAGSGPRRPGALGAARLRVCGVRITQPSWGEPGPCSPARALIGIKAWLGAEGGLGVQTCPPQPSGRTGTCPCWPLPGGLGVGEAPPLACVGAPSWAGCWSPRA